MVGVTDFRHMIYCGQWRGLVPGLQKQQIVFFQLAIVPRNWWFCLTKWLPAGWIVSLWRIFTLIFPHSDSTPNKVLLNWFIFHNSGSLGHLVCTWTDLNAYLSSSHCLRQFWNTNKKLGMQKKSHSDLCFRFYTVWFCQLCDDFVSAIGGL